MQMRQGFLLRAAVAAAFMTGPALAATAPFSFDSTPGRLPKDVMPIDYHIDFTPDLKTHRIAGHERILVEVRHGTATLQFNTLNETLRKVTFDGKPVKQVRTDNPHQLTTITLPTTAPVGQHTLAFDYVGQIETSPVGLFVQPYTKQDGKQDVMLSSQFEATDARRLFPCWDEPAFRATYALSATIQSDWVAVSNMPIVKSTTHGRRTTVAFAPTPKMPSYLVEFTAGHLAHVDDQIGETQLSIWATQGQEASGKEALANTKQILADYNDYFGVPFPLPKLNSIAIPGGFPGAMENWGAITYNDQMLLVTPSSTMGDRQEAYSTQAHEIAHQWNGDLVTMSWWDDLWLNESFASWRAAKETAERHPSWHWWESEDKTKEAAMAADAHPSSHAIEQHVTDELGASTAFDPDITYSKGEAVLRMLEAYLGPDVFRDGIRRYMKSRAYSNATSADLWAALSAASGQDVAKVASTWTAQAGFPLVSVATQCDASGQRTLALSQQRFLLGATDPAQSHWQIPLHVRVGTAGNPQSVLLSTDGQTIAAGRCDEPLSVNADTLGFYRVAYDDATLTTNTKAFASLPHSDRLALIDDQWALVTTGKQPLSSFMALASAMGNDLDEQSWQRITAALETIEFDEVGQPGHDAFVSYAASILQPLAERLGWDAKPDETPGIRHLRRIVLGDLGTWGDASVVAEARRRFTAFIADRSSLKADDQGLVLSIVAHHADAATFAQLHAVAKSAHNETELRRYYLALMHVHDAQLASEAAKIALSSEIPAQAGMVRLEMVGQLHGLHPQLSWDTYRNNLASLLAPLQPEGPMVVASATPQLFWNSVAPDELETWIKGHVPTGMEQMVSRGMETARSKLSERTTLVSATDRFIQSQSSTM